LTSWLRRWLGPDEPQTPDADQVIELTTLPLWQTPMMVAALADIDIRATFVETAMPIHSKLYFGQPVARIFVRQRDRARAQALVTHLTTPD
jgi:hypothetical protein